MTKGDLKRLKNKLPKGYNAMIMERTALSLATVSSVMNGRWKNQKVIDAAFEILQEQLDKQRQQEQLLSS